MNGIIQLVPRIPKNITKFVRCSSVLPNISNQNEKSSEDFVPVYKFPYILPFSLINRLKVYQTALAGISIPVSIGLWQTGYISDDAVQFTVSLGLSGCLALYSLGYLTQNFVGFIYYSEEKDIVKISYLDFWGNRKDIEIPTKDIVPFNELPTTPLSGLFYTIRRFSSQSTLKLNLRLGIILDIEKMKRIF